MSKLVFNISFTAKTPPAQLSGIARAKYEQERRFFNMTAEYNYFSYVLDGKKVEKNKDAEKYFTRTNENADPENTGLFGFNGRLSPEDVAALKRKLTASGSIIWHGFLSFDEETSKGFTSQEQAVAFLTQSFGSFLDRTHLHRDNIELYAALHTDTDNRHIHFAFFEREPHRNSKGELVYTQRGAFTHEAIDDYLVSANMYLSDNLFDYYAARDMAMEKLKAYRAAGSPAQPQAVAAMVRDVAAKLPKTGRLGYNSANMTALRPEIDTLSLALIASRPETAAAHAEVMRQLALREWEAFNIARENRVAYLQGKRLSPEQQLALMGLVDGDDLTNTPLPLELVDEKTLDVGGIDYIRRLREDYRARIGNQAISFARAELKAQYHGAASKSKRVNDKSRKIVARKDRLRRSRAFAALYGALGTVQRGICADFARKLHEAEREIGQEKKAVVNE
jgi:hypothetical protein